MDEFSQQLLLETKRSFKEGPENPEDFNQSDFNVFYSTGGLEDLNLNAEELEKIKVEFFYSN